MSVYVKSRAELEQELREQMAALRASAAAYDEGNLWEAKRLAATVYILVNDGGKNSQSLLTQLQLRRAVSFISSLAPRPNDDFLLPLAAIHVDIEAESASFRPYLDDAAVQTPMKFSKWWDEGVFVDREGRNLTRRNLVFQLRSKMGGAHVDATVEDQTFQLLAKGRYSVTVHYNYPEGSVDGHSDFINLGLIPNGHLASMRQIAWELDKSISPLGY